MRRRRWAPALVTDWAVMDGEGAIAGMEKPVVVVAAMLSILNLFLGLFEAFLQMTKVLCSEMKIEVCPFHFWKEVMEGTPNLRPICLTVVGITVLFLMNFPEIVEDRK